MHWRPLFARISLTALSRTYFIMYIFQTEQKRFPPVNDTVLLLFLYLPMHIVDKLSLAGFNKYIDVLIICKYCVKQTRVDP